MDRFYNKHSQIGYQKYNSEEYRKMIDERYEKLFDDYARMAEGLEELLNRKEEKQ